MKYEYFEDETMAITGYTESATRVIIPSEIDGLPVTRIGREVFHGCKALQEVRISEGVMEIGGLAFEGCTSLSKIELPDILTSIGVDAFAGCKDLQEIKIPEGVTSIGIRAFDSRVTLVVESGSYAEIYAKQNGWKRLHINNPAG